MKNLKILVADDNEQVRELMTHMLSREHTQVTVVSNGQEAIERLCHAHYPFDLVISDVEMPNVDGWGLLAWVRKHDSTLPVVLMSAGLPTSFIRTARNAGACGAIPKPFRTGWLQELLSDLFEGPGQCRRQDFYTPLEAAA